jgi:hypothetical protein
MMLVFRTFSERPISLNSDESFPIIYRLQLRSRVVEYNLGNPNFLTEFRVQGV